MNAIGSKLVAMVAVACLLVVSFSGADDAVKESVSARSFTLIGKDGKAVGYFTTDEKGDPVITIGKGESEVFITVDNESSMIRTKVKRKVALVTSDSTSATFGIVEDGQNVWNNPRK